MNVLDNLYEFYANFGGEKTNIGTSLFERQIPCFFVGKNKSPKILIHGGIHAREYVTVALVLKLTQHYFEMRPDYGIYFIPAVNPDGIALVLDGLQSAPQSMRKFLKRINGNDFSLYKANGRGVDLNQNFPARWGKGALNTTKPSGGGYIGKQPLSEPESIALAKFTESVRPDVTVSYHSKGEEIYWYFNQSEHTERDRRIATAVSLETGYPMRYTHLSVGGYKDWCVEQYKIPSFTIEVGADSLKHPISLKYADEIFVKNKNVAEVLSREWKKENNI